MSGDTGAGRGYLRYQYADAEKRRTQAHARPGEMPPLTVMERIAREVIGGGRACIPETAGCFVADVLTVAARSGEAG